MITVLCGGVGAARFLVRSGSVANRRHRRHRQHRRRHGAARAGDLARLDTVTYTLAARSTPTAAGGWPTRRGGRWRRCPGT